jgi:hypothetical protein
MTFTKFVSFTSLKTSSEERGCAEEDDEFGEPEWANGWGEEDDELEEPDWANG